MSNKVVRKARRSQGRTNLSGNKRYEFLSAPNRLPCSKNSEGTNTPSTSVMRKSVSAKHLRRLNKAARLQKEETVKQKSKFLGVGYDIDGDGVVDAREMKLAQKLHNIVDDHRKNMGTPTDEQLQNMRQKAGRNLIACDFVDRNEGKLWRYGDIFSGKTNEEAIEYIQEHPHFKKILPYLEAVERNRIVRSSHGFRNCFTKYPQSDLQVPQTWLQTPRKEKILLEPKKLEPYLGKVTEEPEFNLSNQDVLSNNYGAIDIDGDGVIDFEEMKLHLRLQSNKNSLDSDHNRKMQKQGREMMAKDFVMNHVSEMWKFGSKYKGKGENEIIDMIANNDQFSKEMNKLKAKERVLQLKSSNAVMNCLADPPAPAQRIFSPEILTTRAVGSYSELAKARCDAIKQNTVHNRAIFIKKNKLNKSDSAPAIHFPKLYNNPIKLESLDMTITKWTKRKAE